MKIYDSLNVEMDIIVASFTKKTDQTKILTKLYNGTYQTQSIGNTAYNATVVVYATTANMDILNLAEAESDYLKIEKDSVSYRGYIKDSISWSRYAGNIYKGSFVFMINEVV